MSTPDHRRYLDLAVELARRVSLEDRTAGPFGAVVVRDGEVIAEAVNTVLSSEDPTCHAEMQAIRAAASSLGSHVLEGCTLYSSSEPCPMCYGAAWWARIEAIWCAGSVDDAARWGDFDDRPMYDALTRPPADRPLQCCRIECEAMHEIWQAFNALPNRLHY